MKTRTGSRMRRCFSVVRNDGRRGAVGQLATTQFSGGVLVELPSDAVEEGIDQPLKAIARDAPVGYLY